MQKRPIKKSEKAAEVPKEAPATPPAADEAPDPADRLNKARDAWMKHHDATAKPGKHYHEGAHHHAEPCMPLSNGQYGNQGSMPFVHGPLPMYAYPMGGIPVPPPAPQSKESPPSEPQPKLPWPTMPPQTAAPVQGQVFDSLGKLMQLGVSFATTALSSGMQMMQGMGAVQHPLGQSHHGHHGSYDGHKMYGDDGSCGYDEHNRYHHGNDSCGRCGCSHVNGC